MVVFASEQHPHGHHFLVKMLALVVKVFTYMYFSIITLFLKVYIYLATFF